MTTPIYIINKYYTLYHNIISLAISKNRYKSKEHYYENHHIIPDSFGGSEEPENKVLLTAREHYICHYLLTKFTTSIHKHKMIHSFNMMHGNFNNKRHINSKLYNSNKILLKNYRGKIHHMYGTHPSKETLIKLSKSHSGENNGFYNKTHSKESKEKMRNSKIGKKMSSIAKQNMSKSQLGRTHSNETKQKIANSNKRSHNKNHKIKWIVPWGTFISYRDACTKLVKESTIQIWCKNPDKIISNSSFKRSKYLQSLNDSPIGKTFKELGFYLLPVDPKPPVLESV